MIYWISQGATRPGHRPAAADVPGVAGMRHINPDAKPFSADRNCLAGHIGGYKWRHEADAEEKT